MKKITVNLAALAVLTAGRALAEEPGQEFPVDVDLQRAHGLAQASVRTQTALTEVQP